MTKTQIDNIEALRNIALAHNEIMFTHLCVEALCGEKWAETRMLDVVDACDGLTTDAVLAVIRATDTSRPDGAIARGPVEV